MNKFNRLAVLSLAIFVSAYWASWLATAHQSVQHKQEHESHNTEQIRRQHKRMISNQIKDGNYACCLEKPCSSCLELTPWHGKDEACHCLTDVVEGRSPCDECVGGILAGRGNKFLAPYFAKSLAEGVGEEHTLTLRKIMQQKYETLAKEQTQ